TGQAHPGARRPGTHRPEARHNGEERQLTQGPGRAGQDRAAREHDPPAVTAHHDGDGREQTPVAHGRAETMTSTTEHTAISLTPAAEPRLRLQPDRSARTLLDGGWWPRSADPAAELPGLILALDERHGPVTQIMLGSAGWDASRPGRLRVDDPVGRRVVRLGWYE